MRFNCILKLFLLVAIFSTLNGMAADRIRHYTERDGLSSRMIHHCLRDSRGFLWVATANGLNRFDGYKFWKPDKQKLNLTSSRITWLLEDHNNLWIGTDNGINLMNLSTYHLSGVFRHNNENTSLYDNYITGIFHSRDSAIWVTTGKGMVHVYQGFGKFKQVKNPIDQNGSFGIRIFVTEDDQFFWIKSENKGTYKLNKSGKLISYYKQEGESHIGGIRYIQDIGTLTFNRSGIKRYNAINNQFEPYQPTFGTDVYDMVPDGLQKFWIVKNDSRNIGVINQNILTDKTTQLFPPPYVVHIRTIIPGVRKSLWICTNNGLYHISNDRELFTTILKADQVNDPAYIPSFRGMLEDSYGHVFYGGYGGIFKRDKLNQLHKLVSNDIPLSPYALIDDNKQWMWAVTEGFGLIHINKENGKIEHLFKNLINSDHHRYQYLNAAYKDHDGTIWLGGYEGMFKYNPKKDKIQEVNLWFDNHLLGKMTIRQIKETSDGKLWISTQQGVYVLSKDRKPLFHFSTESPEPYRIPENTVSGILESSTGQIWIGTIGGGICVWNPIKNNIITYNIGNGLADNQVVSILEDKSGRIWIATNFGLSMLNAESGLINNFYSEDGIADNEFNAASSLRLKNGTLLFGGVNGITVCDPEANLQTEEKPQYIQFSRLELMDRNGAIQEYFSPDEIKNGIQLGYENRYINLDFFITDFLRVEKNAFSYHLEGFDKRWIPIGEQNNLRFAMLPAGKFVLHLKGNGFRGTPTLNEVTVPIIIDEVFYRTWWFYLLVLTLLVLLVYLTLFQQIRKLRYLNALRSKLSSDLHDDVGSVLTRIAMQAELIEDQVNPESKKTIQSIMASCRNALNNMRDLIWSMDNRKLNAGNLFDKTTELCHNMFDESGKSIEIKIDKNLYQIPIRQKTREELYFIIKEALHNMLKYGNETDNVFEATLSKDKVVIELMNSINEKQGNASSSYGIRNMNMRASRINAHFAYKILHPTTFDVRIEIPFSKFSMFKKTL